jgi:hypothetical protein
VPTQICTRSVVDLLRGADPSRQGPRPNRMYGGTHVKTPPALAALSLCGNLFADNDE